MNTQDVVETSDGRLEAMQHSRRVEHIITPYLVFR
jgi:hypothetical protein